MIPAVIPDSQGNATQPKDWDESRQGRVGNLPYRRVIIDDVAFLESAWEPTTDEIAAIVAGGKVLLRLSVAQHPVTSLSVLPPEPEMTGLTYAIAGDPQTHNVLVWDEVGNKPIDCCVEVNTIEGWAVVYETDADGNYIPTSNGEALTKRIEGQFTIRRPYGAANA